MSLRRAEARQPTDRSNRSRLGVWGLVAWWLCAALATPAPAQTSTLAQPGMLAQPDTGFDPYQLSDSSLPQPVPLYTNGDDAASWFASEPLMAWPTGAMGWEALPTDTIYPFYLGDLKSSRLSGIWSGGDEQLVDAKLGGRFGLLRFNRGQEGPFLRGTQVDVEGSGQLRLAPSENMDLRSVDFRAGVPVSFGFGRFHTRVGYYHLSSHVGDEFLLRRPDFNRLNFSRDVLYLGAGYWLTPQTRVYGETGWAFYSDVSKEWEFMFGIERAPRFATGLAGGLFYAAHAHLREELNYSGHFTGQIGWAWRRDERSGLLRIGLDYFNGKSRQYSFFREHEQQLGFGVWYDF